MFITGAKIKVLGGGADHFIVPVFCIVSVTTPGIVFGVFYHTRTNRVEFDIATAGQQVILAVYDSRTIATFPGSTGAPMALVIVLYEVTANRLQGSRNTVQVARAGQNVHMIRH